MPIADIHLHLLPGVDDGPKDWGRVEEMLAEMAGKGVKAVAATPHVFEEDGVEKALDKRRDLVKLKELGEKFGVRVVGGAEFWASPDLPDRIADLLPLTYDGKGKYLLVEFPPMEKPLFTEWLLSALRVKGITPIIAHPERYAWVQRDEKTLWGLLKQGALLQVTAEAILKERSFEGRLAWRWLYNGLVDCLSSDWHGSKGEPYLLPEALEQVAKKLGEKEALRLGWLTPSAIVAGQPVTPAWKQSPFAAGIKGEARGARRTFILWWYRWLSWLKGR